MSTNDNWWAAAQARQEAAETPLYRYPMLVTPGRVRGRVSDFREGTVTLTDEGISVDGRAVLPAGQRALILLASIFVGVLIVLILLEYAIRVARSHRLPWSCVDEIVLEPHKNRVCLAYHLPERPDSVFSLAFRLTPPLLYENFVQAARHFAPEKVREGKIAPPTPWWVFVAVIVLFFALVLFLTFYLSRPGA